MYSLKKRFCTSEICFLTIGDILPVINVFPKRLMFKLRLAVSTSQQCTFTNTATDKEKTTYTAVVGPKKAYVYIFLGLSCSFIPSTEGGVFDPLGT